MTPALLVQSLYLVVLLGTLVVALRAVLERPVLARAFLAPGAIRLWSAMGAAWVFVLLAMAGSWIMREQHVGPVLSSVSITGLMLLMLTAGCYPAAAALDTENPAPLRSVSFFVLAIAVLLWSFTALELLRPLIDWKVKPGGFVDQVSIGRPFEFAAIAGFALLAAVAEEIIFRGVLQPALRSTGLPIVAAIFLTSLAWAVGHSGYIEPFGVKELQVLGLGLGLGYARWKFGLRGAIGLHLANNASALLLEVLLRSTEY